MKKYFLLALMVASFLLDASITIAQKDDLSDMRQLLKICNVYDRVPVSVTVRLQNSANIVTQQEDTSLQQIYCYVDRHMSYVSMGELEQLADDSMLLLVNNTTQRMQVTRHPESVTEKMTGYFGLVSGDSSAAFLARSYQLTAVPGGSDTAAMILVSKEKIFRTGISRDSVYIRYVVKDSQMVETKRFRRTLMKMDKEDYTDLLKNEYLRNDLIRGNDSLFFLVKTRQSTCSYLSVSHEERQNRAPSVIDRIEAGLDGRYRAKGVYAQYIVTKGY